MPKEPATCFIFGYGSLMWNPGFHFKRKFEATALNWQRRFWQKSPDHRGTERDPGIVVTLDQVEQVSCFGICYEVETDNAEIFDYLDHREKGGYSCLDISVQSFDGSELHTALCYIGLPDNPYYLGPTPEHLIAETIFQSTGPSGTNLDYFMNLKRFLDQKEIEEAHIRVIADHLED